MGSERGTNAGGRRTAWLVAAIALLGFVRVLVGNASFPMFTMIDEPQHVDRMAKVMRGELLPTSGLDFEEDVLEVYWLHESPAYTEPPPPNGYWPLYVKWPEELQERHLAMKRGTAERWLNHQVYQPPFYYLGAGAVLAAARSAGLSEITALYVVRFANALTVALAIVLTWLLARRVTPHRAFLAWGAAILLALFPQDVFYMIHNDVPAVALFPLALLLLWRARDQDAGDAVRALAGLTVAAAFLIKPVNVTLVVAAVALLAPPFVRGIRRREPGTWRRALVPALAAALPVAVWLGYKVAASGVLTGLDERAALTGSTPNSFAQMLEHPIFTPSGAFTFGSELLLRFWTGELHWHGKLIHPVLAGHLLSASSVVFCGASAWASLRRRPDRLPDAFAAAAWAAALFGVAMLVWLSISWDFGTNYYPSRAFPYFVSGRLLNGLAAPFFLVYLDGLWRLTRPLDRRLPWLALALLALALAAVVLHELARAIGNPHNLWHL